VYHYVIICRMHVILMPVICKSIDFIYLAPRLATIRCYAQTYSLANVPRATYHQVLGSAPEKLDALVKSESHSSRYPAYLDRFAADRVCMLLASAALQQGGAAGLFPA
jgi:hypothetical protein